MDRLFHFSDFHITLNSGEPNYNTSFQVLLSTLKGFQNKNFTNYIAFTGDVVDGEYILKQPNPEETRIKCFQLAEKYFRELRDALNVPKENLVFCCGNHDIIRGTYAGAHAVCDPEINYNTDLFCDGYSAFSDFHRRATGRGYSHVAHAYPIGDFLFILANSTWIEKQEKNYVKDTSHKNQMQLQHKRCIDCRNLGQLINENAKDLAKRASQGRSILLVHDPVIEWCENSLIDYESEKKAKDRSSKEVYSLLSNYFGYCLCGDKHATANIAGFRLVKTKLNASQMSFGLISYSDDGLHQYSVYKCQNDMFKLVPTREDLNAISKISSEYIKQLAVGFLTGDISGSASTETIVHLIESNLCKEGRWEKISDFLKLFTSYEKTRLGQSAVRENINGNIFNRITEDFCNGKSSAEWMAVRSIPAQGKSVFLSLEYLYLLKQYQEGNIDFIPAYINLEKIAEKEPEAQKEEITSFFSSAEELGKQTQKKVRYILDGLNAYQTDEYSVSNHTIEDFINEHGINSYITAFDISPIHKAPETALSCSRSAKYLLYFSGISTVEKTTSFLQAIELFCELFNRGDSKQLITSINRLKFGQINLNLLFRFADLLSENSGDIVNLFDRYFAEILHITQDRRARLMRVAYDIHVKGKNFQQLDVKIERSDYEILRREKEVASFLIADFYYDSIINCISPKSRPILGDFFQQEQNIYLNALFEKRYDEDKFSKFIKKHFSNLSYKGKSQFIYLVRQKRELLDVIPYKENLKKQNNKEDQLRIKIANRTWMISKGCSCSGGMNSYISKLLHSSEERHLNRIVHMYYYGDVSFEETCLLFQYPTVFQGFDIYHSYHALVYRINSLLTRIKCNHMIANDEQIILLDMFTLCDMLLFHLYVDQAITRTKSNGEERTKVASYFYTSEYSRSSVAPRIILQNTLKVLSEVNFEMEIFEFLGNDGEEILEYFLFAESKLRSVYQKYDDNWEHRFCSGDFSVISYLETLETLATERRTGWNINDTHSELRTYLEIRHFLDGHPVHETVLEHIFETYVIGLLFLPEKDESIVGYNKQEILNTILIHDLGESNTGDCPPFAEDYSSNKDQEQAFMTELLMLGAVSDLADLSSYLKLWKEWKELENENARIARDLDKIQMAYKFKELITQGKLNGFTQQRKKEFESVGPKTSIGKKIYRELIEGFDKLYVE